MKQLHNEADALVALEGLLDLVTIFSDRMEKGMQERGLTRARAAILWELGGLGPTTQKSLADRLCVTPRNVTGLVDALADSGYVTREKHPTDRRALLVTLTHKGIEHVETMHQEFQRWAKGLFRDVSGEHISAFTSVTATLRTRMRPQ